MDAKKQTQTVSWDELPPDVVFNLNDRLLYGEQKKPKWRTTGSTGAKSF